MSGDMLENAALVVAHPDDEILWFSSIADKVREVIVCFLDVRSRPDWTEGRRRAAAVYPLPNTTFLGLTESEVFNGADWLAPVLTSYGLEVTKRDGAFSNFSTQRYRDNFEELKQLLRKRLRNCTNVFTHNPWGEYGHEEHVQVCRAVKSLQLELGFNLWFSNYCSNKSYNLMLRHVESFRSDYVMLPTNPDLAERIKALYRANGCWTWFDDYTWFTHECFQQDHPDQRAHAKYGQRFSLNYFRIEAPWEKELPPRWRRVAAKSCNVIRGLISR